MGIISLYNKFKNENNNIQQHKNYVITRLLNLSLSNLFWKYKNSNIRDLTSGVIKPTFFYFWQIANDK